MTKPLQAYFYLLLFFLSFTHNCNAQKFTDSFFHKLYDQKVGVENTDLYQGVIFITQFRTSTDKTPFFKSKNFVKGAVEYDGQFYRDLDLKYDVNGDRVLIKLVPKAGGGTLILFNDILERFEIEGSNFIKIEKDDAPELGTYGFFEVSLKSLSFTLYTKYNKKRVRKKDRESMYYDFVDASSLYILNYKDTYHTLNSKKDVKTLFPNMKKEIDKFYASTNKLRKSSRDDFQVALFKRIEILLSQNANTL